MRDFQQFWRENSDIWSEKTQYKEAAPHLILYAFLQRVINGGGQILREMATGTGRVDLCIIYENQKYPIELKISDYFTFWGFPRNNKNAIINIGGFNYGKEVRPRANRTEECYHTFANNARQVSRNRQPSLAFSGMGERAVCD
jgi:hypothetical protein